MNSLEDRQDDMAAQSSIASANETQGETYISWMDQSTLPLILITNIFPAVPTPSIADVRHRIKYRINHHIHSAECIA
jgi:hypothetical protein